MNTPVSFEIAKLLKEKGFDEKCSHYYINDFQNFKHDGKLYKTSLPNDWDNENIFQYVKRTKQPHLCNAPTIAEVVMWLYDKHKVWINVTIFQTDTQRYWQCWIQQLNEETICVKTGKHSHTPSAFNSPTDAYEAAIEYVLINLI